MALLGQVLEVVVVLVHWVRQLQNLGEGLAASEAAALAALGRQQQVGVHVTSGLRNISVPT